MSFVKVLCRECGVLEKDERNIRDIDILERYCIQQRGDSERDGFCRNGFCVEDMVYNGKVIFLVRFAVQRDGVCKEIQRERDIYTVYKDIQKDTVYRERALERELWRERDSGMYGRHKHKHKSGSYVERVLLYLQENIGQITTSLHMKQIEFC